MNRREIAILLGCGVAGFALGCGSAYLYVRKQLSEAMEIRVSEEVEAARNHYKQIYDKNGYSTPEEAVKALMEYKEPPAIIPAEPRVKEIIRESREKVNYNGIASQYQGEPPIASTVRNIWENGGKPEPPRGPDGRFLKQDSTAEPQEDPYIIDEEDFNQNDTEYDQEEVTYHVNDNTILDAQGDVVENEIIGEVNLSLFRAEIEKDLDAGHALYVRNEKIKMEYLVVVSHESITAMTGLNPED